MHRIRCGLVALARVATLPQQKVTPNFGHPTLPTALPAAGLLGAGYNAQVLHVGKADDVDPRQAKAEHLAYARRQLFPG